MKLEPFKSVYINPDLSVKERNAQKELREELKRRKNGGEVHLKIFLGKIVKNISETPMTVEHAPSQHEPENSNQSG